LAWRGDLRLHHQRDEQVDHPADDRSPEAAFRDTHDSERLRVDSNRPADDLLVGAEHPAPEPVADHRNRMSAWRDVVTRIEHAPELGGHTEHLEITSAHDLGPHPLGSSIVRDAEPLIGRRRQRRKHLVVVADVLEVGVGQRHDPTAGRPRDDYAESVRIIHARQRPQRDSLEQAEHRRVCANADPEHRDDDEGEARGSPQQPHRIGDVARKIGNRLDEPLALPASPRGFSCQHHVAEVLDRGQPGGFRVVARLDPHTYVHGEMSVDFLAEIDIAPAALKEPLPGSHSCSFMIRATASTSWLQRSRSRSNCRFPSAVSR
jgi:hypothetical protein